MGTIVDQAKLELALAQRKVVNAEIYESIINLYKQRKGLVIQIVPPEEDSRTAEIQFFDLLPHINAEVDEYGFCTKGMSVPTTYVPLSPRIEISENAILALINKFNPENVK